MEELPDQVLSVRVSVMKRALPSLVSPNPDSTMSITSFTTGSFRFMPRLAATSRGKMLKTFMVSLLTFCSCGSCQLSERLGSVF